MFASAPIFFLATPPARESISIPVFFPLFPNPPVEPFVTLCVFEPSWLSFLPQSRDMRWMYGIAITSVISAMTQAMAAP